MIRAVLDTNVLASATLSKKGLLSHLKKSWKARIFILVTSRHILKELGSTLSKPYFADKISPQERVQIVKEIAHLAALTKITARVSGVAPSKADDQVLATAESGKADYVVTGDKGVQKIREHKGIRIVTPRSFLEVLRSRS